jgi:hypothetical protein
VAADPAAGRGGIAGVGCCIGLHVAKSKAGSTSRSGGFAPRRRPTLFACPKESRQRKGTQPVLPACGGSPALRRRFGDRQKLAALEHLPVCFPKRPLRSGSSGWEGQNASFSCGGHCCRVDWCCCRTIVQATTPALRGGSPGSEQSAAVKPGGNSQRRCRRLLLLRGQCEGGAGRSARDLVFSLGYMQKTRPGSTSRSGGFAPRRRPTLFACPKESRQRKGTQPNLPACGGSPPLRRRFGDRQKLAALEHLPVCFPKRPLRSGSSGWEGQRAFGLVGTPEACLRPRR